MSMAAREEPRWTTIQIVDPVNERHYALSEDAELQLRILRDGLRAVANLARGEEEPSMPIPETIAGDDLAAIFDVFGIACGAIISTVRFAGPSQPIDGRP